MVRRALAVLVVGALSALSVMPAAGAVAQEQQAPERVEKIDINRADEAELQRVPGIGPAMAQRIVEWRNEHGRFERLDDLLDIRGIGVKTLEKFRPYLEVRKEDKDGGRSGRSELP